MENKKNKKTCILAVIAMCVLLFGVFTVIVIQANPMRYTVPENDFIGLLSASSDFSIIQETTLSLQMDLFPYRMRLNLFARRIGSGSEYEYYSRDLKVKSNVGVLPKNLTKLFTVGNNNESFNIYLQIVKGEICFIRVKSNETSIAAAKTWKKEMMGKCPELSIAIDKIEQNAMEYFNEYKTRI